jgi:hypothetical protein
MLHEMPRRFLRPHSTNLDRLARLGERRDPVQKRAVGDRVRALVVQGLFWGSIIEGVVSKVTPPRPPHTGLGVPMRDPRSTVYQITDYQIDGRGHSTRNGQPVSGPDVRTDGLGITLDDGDVWFLLPREPGQEEGQR